MAKHVIILGAGSSFTSGYPTNNRLGSILSSSERFEQYVQDQDAAPQLKEKLIREFLNEEKWLDPFREGAFGSADEFSFVARGKLKSVVQDLKWYISWIFALHNPEGSYPKPGSSDKQDTTGRESSDYYPFIQKLFGATATFHDLPKEIAVLTYNYDAYFEYLLSKAYKARKRAMGDELPFPTALLSGFDDLNAATIRTENNFCLLKLHGTSVLPAFDSRDQPPRILTFDEVFENRAKLAMLPDPLRVERPKTFPIFFPWELITEQGEFVSKEQFRDVKHTVDNREYYDIFRAIWERGQREVKEAERISFVGFSGHPFMEHGLRFLFKARARQIEEDTKRPLEVVTANPDSVPKGHRGNAPPPGGHVNRLQKLLEAACPGLPFADLPPGKPGLGKVACYPDFKSFLYAEL